MSPMPPARRPALEPPKPRPGARPVARPKPGVTAILAELRRHGSARDREGMARFGIVTPKILGIRMNVMQAIAKRIGKDHALAQKLWAMQWYEARMVAAFIDDPALVTPAQMDRWARDFDNWAICDTVCFHLFDRTPHAFGRIRAWATRREEFMKRAAFALIASVALHQKQTPDSELLKTLPLIERAATDERNFVKKGVSWALRCVGRRKGVKPAAIALANKTRQIRRRDRALDRQGRPSRPHEDALRRSRRTAGPASISRQNGRTPQDWQIVG